MEQQTYDQAERTIRGLLYDMTDKQREHILFSVKAQAPHTVKTVIVSRET